MLLVIPGRKQIPHEKSEIKDLFSLWCPDDKRNLIWPQVKRRVYLLWMAFDLWACDRTETPLQLVIFKTVISLNSFPCSIFMTHIWKLVQLCLLNIEREMNGKHWKTSSNRYLFPCSNKKLKLVIQLSIFPQEHQRNNKALILLLIRWHPFLSIYVHTFIERPSLLYVSILV